MEMRRIFRAKASGGITPAEARRREAAVLASMSEASRPAFPAPMPHFEPVEPGPSAEVPAVEDPVADDPDPCPLPDAAPIVSIEIAGPAGAGKSAVAHLIRTALSREAIAFEGPDDLPSMDLRWALRVLRERGLRIQIVETETAVA